jgi:hypothetical protein
VKTLYIIIIFVAVAITGLGQAQISQSQSGGHIYYHIVFALTSSNSTIEVPTSLQNPQTRPESISAFGEGGLFEVFIHAPDFPVSAPDCNSGWIVLRMPSTSTEVTNAAQKITEKKILWDRLQKMYSQKSGTVDVVIELNPYIHVTDPTVPKVELEFCNVFFRQAYGAYVPYLGPIKTSDKSP